LVWSLPSVELLVFSRSSWKGQRPDLWSKLIIDEIKTILQKSFVKIENFTK